MRDWAFRRTPLWNENDLTTDYMDKKRKKIRAIRAIRGQKSARLENNLRQSDLDGHNPVEVEDD